MTIDSTPAARSMSPITLPYPFVASHASCQRPRAAHAESGMGANSTATPARNNQKDFM